MELGGQARVVSWTCAHASLHGVILGGPWQTAGQWDAMVVWAAPPGGGHRDQAAAAELRWRVGACMCQKKTTKKTRWEQTLWTHKAAAPRAAAVGRGCSAAAIAAAGPLPASVAIYPWR